MLSHPGHPLQTYRHVWRCSRGQINIFWQQHRLVSVSYDPDNHLPCCCVLRQVFSSQFDSPSIQWTNPQQNGRSCPPQPHQLFWLKPLRNPNQQVFKRSWTHRLLTLLSPKLLNRRTYCSSNSSSQYLPYQLLFQHPRIHRSCHLRSSIQILKTSHHQVQRTRSANQERHLQLLWLNCRRNHPNQSFQENQVKTPIFCLHHQQIHQSHLCLWSSNQRFRCLRHFSDSFANSSRHASRAHLSQPWLVRSYSHLSHQHSWTSFRLTKINYSRLKFNGQCIETSLTRTSPKIKIIQK